MANGRMAGEMATIGTFSFFPSKNLGGYGDGGMIVTQDADLAMKLRRLRTHGAIKTYVHEVVGFNSRLDTLQAAVLSGEASVPRRVERRAPQARRVLRRGVRGSRRHSHAGHRLRERVHL